MNKKCIVIGSALISAFLITGVYFYTKVYSEKINVVNYKEPDQIIESGYQITKYEDVNAVQWIDENNILVLRDIPENNKINTANPKRILSMYNLNTKTYKDFKDVIVTAWDIKDVSYDGRYVLYREGKNEENESEKLAYPKINILDLSTGNIIKDIDNTRIYNFNPYIKWTANNHLFVFDEGQWRIIDVNGKILKEGTVNTNNYHDVYANIIGISDIDDSKEDISGKFYYCNVIGKDDDGDGMKLYSMDINSMEESYICKIENPSGMVCKKGNNIIWDYCKKNNEADKNDNGENDIFGFKIINEKGDVLQDIQILKGDIDDLLQLSGDGERASFINACNYLNFNDRSTLDDTIKIVNVSNGNIKEVGKIRDLIDNDKDESFYKVRQQDDDGNIASENLPGPAFGRIKWDKRGKSLFYNYKYTSKKDGENHTDTYVVTFD